MSEIYLVQNKFRKESSEYTHTTQILRNIKIELKYNFIIHGPNNSHLLWQNHRDIKRGFAFNWCLLYIGTLILMSMVTNTINIF